MSRSIIIDSASVIKMGREAGVKPANYQSPVNEAQPNELVANLRAGEANSGVISSQTIANALSALEKGNGGRGQS